MKDNLRKTVINQILELIENNLYIYCNSGILYELDSFIKENIDNDCSEIPPLKLQSLTEDTIRDLLDVYLYDLRTLE